MYSTPGSVQSCFSCFIQDGKIMSNTWEGVQQIGVALSVYNDLDKNYKEIFQRTQEYHQRLVELGEIEPQLTQEEIIAKQTEQLKQTEALLEQSRLLQRELLTEIQALKGARHDQSVQSPGLNLKNSGAEPAMEEQNKRSPELNKELPKQQGRSDKGPAGKKS